MQPGLKFLVTGNCAGVRDNVATALSAESGVTSATAFDTSASTPTAAQLAAVDGVISLGDSCNGYNDAATWGDRLANYADHGGVVLQAAYDNWNDDTAHPLGRFSTDGYAPLSLGPNDNTPTQLGTVLKPHNAIVQGLDTFVTGSNTTTALAPGATLLAEWADGRNAIAVKGRVVATSASADDATAIPDIDRLAINAVRFFDAPPNTRISRVSVNSGRHLAAFRFSAVGYATGFRCALYPPRGGVVTYHPCSSPKRYTHLTPGKYLFRVMAFSPHGSDLSPAFKHFVISP